MLTKIILLTQYAKFYITKGEIIMKKETITLREGLRLLNTLDRKIKSSSDNTLIAVYSRDTLILDGFTINDWEEQAKDKWRSLNIKIKKRNALKNAILRANLVNTIRVPKFVSLDSVNRNNETEEISFAEAIARKAYYKETLQKIVNKIKIHIEDSNRVYEQFKSKAEIIYDDPCYLGKSISIASENIASYLKKIDRELDKAAGKTEITFEY